MVQQVLREEKKFLLNAEEYLCKSHYLDQVLHQDPHNGINGYRIRSLYFDTIDDGDYFDKLNGLETRRKIRLRCYDPNSNFAMLEMKQKQGMQQRKRSLRITREDAVRMISCDYSSLLSYSEDFAAECYGLMQYRCYRPKTIVEYQRKAYITKENRIRITFDHRIVATESCFDLFSSNLLMNPVLDPYAVVMEVKYNGFLLGYIQQLLNSVDKSEMSVSKYTLARHTGYQNKF